MQIVDDFRGGVEGPLVAAPWPTPRPSMLGDARTLLADPEPPLVPSRLRRQLRRYNSHSAERIGRRVRI